VRLGRPVRRSCGRRAPKRNNAHCHAELEQRVLKHLVRYKPSCWIAIESATAEALCEWVGFCHALGLRREVTALAALIPDGSLEQPSPQGWRPWQLWNEGRRLSLERTHVEVGFGLRNCTAAAAACAARPQRPCGRHSRPIRPALRPANTSNAPRGQYARGEACGPPSALGRHCLWRRGFMAPSPRGVWCLGEEGVHGRCAT